MLHVVVAKLPNYAGAQSAPPDCSRFTKSLCLLDVFTDERPAQGCAPRSSGLTTSEMWEGWDFLQEMLQVKAKGIRQRKGSSHAVLNVFPGIQYRERERERTRASYESLSLLNGSWFLLGQAGACF